MPSKKNAKVKDAQIVETKPKAVKPEPMGHVVEVAAYETQRQSVEGMITAAIKKGADVETMKEVLAMRRELKAEFAKEQFDSAMSYFQAECPPIKRNKDGSKTNAGQVVFRYAPIEVMVTTVQPFLKKNGLRFHFETVKNEQGKVTDVRCIATHSLGHSEYSDFPVSEEAGTSIMSSSQKSASGISYSKRQAFKNMFGIVEEDEDNEERLKKDEGTALAQKSAPTLEQIRELIAKAGYKEGKIAEKFNVGTIDDLDNRQLCILGKSLIKKLNGKE